MTTDPMDSILVVCTGNICRSPVGEGLLRHRLTPRRIAVSSAGTHAVVGRRAAPEAISTVLESTGEELRGRGTQLTLEAIEAARNDGRPAEVGLTGGSMGGAAVAALVRAVVFLLAAGWSFYPTAVGLAPVRTPLAHELLALGPTVVRGNASEVITLTGGTGRGRGADSTLGPDAAAEAYRVYASNEYDASISVIDPETGTVTGTIPISRAWRLVPTNSTVPPWATVCLTNS